MLNLTELFIRDKREARILSLGRMMQGKLLSCLRAMRTNGKMLEKVFRLECFTAEHALVMTPCLNIEAQHSMSGEHSSCMI